MASSKARYLSILAKDLNTTGQVPSTNVLLPDTGVTAGSYGSSSQVPVLAIDSKGRVTSASTSGVAGVTSFGYNTSTGRLTIGTSDSASFTADVTLAPFTTTNLAEGTNQYFTTARARSSISTTGTNLSYNSTSGVLSYTQGNTDTVTEGSTNLYYTDARVQTKLGNVSGHIVPNANITYDLGSSAYRFRDLYLSGSTINLGTSKITTTQDGGFAFRSAADQPVKVELTANTTTDLAEGTNQYFTTARARSSISTTGVNLSYNSTSGVLSYTQGNTDTVAEGATNLYYTNARVRGAISATTGSAAYNSTSGVITIPATSAHITENTNLFFTDARARAAVSGGTGVTYNSSTGVIAIGQPVATTDSVTFNSVTVNGTLTSDDITSTNISIAGNATITGNLTVSGTTTTVNSTTVSVADINIELARNATTAAQANTAGLTITGAGATLTYTSADDRWNLNKDLNVSRVYGNLTGAVTGNASTATTLETTRSITATGDASWTVNFNGGANVSAALTLANSGVTAGTYNNVTVNAKGLVTSGSNVAYLTAESDTLATVTARGASTSTRSTFNSGLTVPDAILNYAGNFQTTDYSTFTFMSRAWSDVQGTNGLAYTFNTHTNAGGGGYGALQIYYGEGGKVQAPTSFRAPIFYDSNDTNWYVDPNGNSRLNQLGVGSNNTSYTFYNNGTSYFNGSVTIDDTAVFTAGNQLQFYTSAGNLRGYINATDIDDNHLQIATSGGEDIVFKDAGLSGTRNLVIRGGNTGTEIYGQTRSPIYYDSADTSYFLDANSTSVLNAVNYWGVQFWSGDGVYARGTNTYGYRFNNYADTINAFVINNSGDTTSYSSARAPIFYDRDDTGYYLDPANISRVSRIAFGTNSNQVNVNYDQVWRPDAGILYLQSSASGNLSLVEGGGSVYVGGTIGGKFSIRAGGAAGVGWGTGFNIGDSSNYLGFIQDAGISRWRNFGTGGYDWWNSSASTQLLFLNNSGDLTASSSMRSPIFYDSANTGYYLDPASTSRFSALDFGSSGYYIHAGDWGMRNTTPYGWIQFGPANNSWAHIYASQNIYFNVNTFVNGNWMLYENTWQNGKYFGSDGIIYSNASMRAPIFYDSDNTGYYTDPASTSRLNSILPNEIQLYAGKIQHGSGSGGTSFGGNHYSQGMDIANGYSSWSYPYKDYIIGHHTGIRIGGYYGYGGTRFYNNSPTTDADMNGHGDDGETLLFSTGMWDNNVRSHVTLYAPFIYDLDDTNYYLNPNSGSRLLHIFAGNVSSSNDGSWNARMNLVGSSHARLDVVSNSDGIITTMFSHTGQGVGKIGTYSNHPLTLMAQGANDGGYVYNGSIRSPIFYDANDTNYYLDPNSNSKLVNLGLGGATPDIRLSVSGDAHVSGYFYMAGTAGSYGSWGSRDYTSGSSRYFNANYYEFNNVGYGSTWSFVISSGDTTSSSSSRAPIFYDSNNTGYYTDPASTSRLNSITIDDGNVQLYKSQTVDMSNTSTYSTSNYYPVTIGVPTGGCWIEIQNNLNSNVPSWATHGGGFTLNLRWWTSGSGWGTTEVKRRVEQYHERFTNSTICGGITQMSHSSTEVVWLRGGGTYYFYFSRNLGATAQSSTFTSNSQSVSPTSSAQNNVWDSASGGHTSYNTRVDADSQMRSPIFYDNNDTNYYVDPNSTSRMDRIYSNYIGVNQGIDTSWPLIVNGNTYLNSGGYGYAEGSWRAPIFYDANDTNYYVDPRSTSRLSGLRLDGVDNQASGDDYILWINKPNNNDWAIGVTGNLEYGIILRMAASHSYAISAQANGSEYSRLGTDLFYHNSNIRAPIFYDQDDTSYYLNPNSTSNIWNLQAGGHVRASSYLQSSGNVYIDGNYGHGVVGVYSSYRYQGVFAMGDSYKLAADGTTTGNLYGLAWSHPNAGGTAGNLNTHGLLVLENGGFLAAVSGSIRARDDMRAPIFYDSNDTGFQADPNGTSKFNTLQFRSGSTDGPYFYYGNNSRNLYLRGATDADIGLSFFDSGGNWRMQLYGASSEYGFLGSNWGSWDLRKVPTGALYMNSDNNYYLQTNGNSQLSFTRFKVSGYPIVDFQNTNAANYGLVEWTENGNHKMWMGMGGSAQSQGENAAYAQDGFSINHDGSGAFTISNRGGSKWIRLSTGTEGVAGFHTFNVRDGNVIVNQNAISYSTHDNTPVVGGGATTNRLHVNGSIQLTNNDDAFVVGRGAASFFKDEELGFGWGGGWYMIDSTWIRARNDKNIYTAGGTIRSDASMWSPIYYDQNDTNWYVDANNISRLKHIDHFSNYGYFRGANRATNDWEYSGLSTNPTVNDYSDGSWYVQSNASDWNRGLLSHARYRRVEGLTFEYEVYITSGSYAMIGFTGGDSTGYGYGQTPANLTYHYNAGLTTYTNGSDTGSDYSFNHQDAWWKYKIVLMGRGARHYVYRNGEWNLIKSVSTNDQNSYEWVRILVSFYNGSINWRDLKVYVDNNHYRGLEYRSNFAGIVRAATDVRAPIFYDSANTAYLFDGAATGTSINVAGSIIAAGNVTAYSDIRLKSNIKLIENAVDKVKQINGVTYDRKENNKRHTGVIAQDVLKVLPEAVEGSEESMYSVAYGNMVGLLVEAIKEQDEKISRLEALVETLINKLGEK